MLARYNRVSIGPTLIRDCDYRILEAHSRPTPPLLHRLHAVSSADLIIEDSPTIATFTLNVFMPERPPLSFGTSCWECILLYVCDRVWSCSCTSSLVLFRSLGRADENPVRSDSFRILYSCHDPSYKPVSLSVIRPIGCLEMNRRMLPYLVLVRHSNS